MNPFDGIHMRTGLDLFAEGMDQAELDSVYYDLVSDREQERLLMESASLDEIDEAYNPGEIEMVLEAITVKKFAQTESKMRALVRTLNTQALKGIAALDAQIGKPRKSGLFATVTVQIPMSDGQVVSIVFHSPTGDEKKILPDDMIVAFRWLLNKRDITHTVSPERGEDVSLQTVAKRVMQLVAKNSEAFQRAQAEIKAQKEELAAAEQSVQAQEAHNQEIQNQIADAGVEMERIEDEIETTRRRLEKVRQENDDLEARLEEMRAKKQEQTASAKLAELRDKARELGFNAEADQLYLAKDEAGLQALIASRPEHEQTEAPDGLDHPTTDPADYAKILADPALQLKYQDLLDSFFQERFAKMVSYLKDDGWTENGPGLQKTVGSKQYSMMTYFNQVGAGKNVVGARYKVFSGEDVVFDHVDDLGHDVRALASWIDSAATGPEVGVLPPAEQIDGNPAKRAAKILHTLGKAEAAMQGGFHVNLKRGAYQDLSIETRDDGGGNRRIYFTQYVDEGGDKIIDSEMVFLTNIYTGLLKLAEIGYRGPMGEVRRTNIGRAEKSWANTFSKSLIDQGFGDIKAGGEDEKNYMDYLLSTLAEADRLESEAKEKGLSPMSREQFMEQINSGERQGFSVDYLNEKLAEHKASLAGLDNDTVSPGEIVGKGGSKIQAQNWLNEQIEKITYALDSGGFAHNSNVTNYNSYLRKLIQGGEKEGEPKITMPAEIPAADLPAGWKAKRTTLGITYVGEFETGTVGIDVTARNDGKFNVLTVRNGGEVQEDHAVLDEDAANKEALRRMKEESEKAGSEPTPPNPEPETRPEAVKILNQIVSGEFDDSPAQIDSLLDQAAEDLEAAGLMEQYDDLLNQAADHYTEVLRKEAA